MPRNPSTPSVPWNASAGQLLFLLQIGHEQVPSLVGEAEVVDGEDAHAEADLGADRD